MILAGNEGLKRTVGNMILKGREPHSVIITGEYGLGRKTAAKYMAAAMLCEHGSGEPCGKCRHCKKAIDGLHPDIINVTPNENGNYAVDDIRAVVSDAIVTPNEGRVKVYIVPDIDRSKITGEQVQNILLKLIEEPPDHTVMILTADSKDAFLQTILSRTVAFGVAPCSREECAQYLGTLGKYEYNDIANAVDSSGGNIGRCIDYLEKGMAYRSAQCAADIARALTGGDEYELLKAVNESDKTKGLLRETLVALSMIARDSAAIALGCEQTLGASYECARAMSARFGALRSEHIYNEVCSFIKKLDSNCSKALVINGLSARLSEV